MGFYSQQAADLSKWEGDQEDAEWRKFRSEFEAKLMPRWVQQIRGDRRSGWLWHPYGPAVLARGVHKPVLEG